MNINQLHNVLVKQANFPSGLVDGLPVGIEADLRSHGYRTEPKAAAGNPRHITRYMRLNDLRRGVADYDWPDGEPFLGNADKKYDMYKKRLPSFINAGLSEGSIVPLSIPGKVKNYIDKVRSFFKSDVNRRTLSKILSETLPTLNK